MKPCGIAHSITYRVAVGPRAGQKVYSLQTVPARAEEPGKGVAQYAGFSLHAGIGVGIVLEPLDFIARGGARAAAAGVAVVIPIVEGLAFFRASGGQRCARRGGSYHERS